MPDEQFKTEDGRRILSVTNAGVSVGLESGEQAAKARQAEIQAEIDEIKLNALRGGIKLRTANNPGPITRR